jgi:superfamily II DNA/RNA helicase
MSRGIDVKEINLVVNFDVPHDSEDYVHRVGRTARVNAVGEAVTFVTPKERQKFTKIEQLIKASVPKIQPPPSLGLVPSWDEPEEKKERRKRDFRRKDNRQKPPWDKRKGSGPYKKKEGKKPGE